MVRDPCADSLHHKLTDITDYDKTERLMFDSSFERSRVYFNSLQVLRIFGQSIRSTRRGIRQLAPESFPSRMDHITSFDRPFILPRSNPREDKILLANWKILWGFYVEAEGELLSRIAEKTEEVKSLRDGVSTYQS
jgi:hypothetical protein